MKKNYRDRANLLLGLVLLMLMSLSIAVQAVVFEDGVYELYNKQAGSAFALSSPGKDVNKSAIRLSKRNGSTEQRFRLANLSGNYVEIYPLASSSGHGRVLDITSNLVGLYTKMAKYSADQRFILKRRSDGFYTIANGTKVFTVPSIRDGTQIVVQPYKAWASQHFQLVKVDSSPVVDTPQPQPSAFNPIWPVPNQFTVTALSRYDSGKAHGSLWKNTLNVMDIGAPAGSKIVAIESGTVVHGRYTNANAADFGYSVRIKCEDGSEVLYAHMKYAPIPAIGKRVSKGDLIGYVGSTGVSTGNHLHLEHSSKNIYRDFFANKYPIKLTGGALKFGQS